MSKMKIFMIIYIYHLLHFWMPFMQKYFLHRRNLARSNGPACIVKQTIATLNFPKKARTSSKWRDSKMLCKFTASQEFEYFTVLPRFLSEFEEYALPSLHSRECDVFLRGKSRTSSCSTRISQIVPKVRFRNLRKLRDARTPRPDRKRERERRGEFSENVSRWRNSTQQLLANASRSISPRDTNHSGTNEKSKKFVYARGYLFVRRRRTKRNRRDLMKPREAGRNVESSSLWHADTSAVFL